MCHRCVCIVRHVVDCSGRGGRHSYVVRTGQSVHLSLLADQTAALVLSVHVNRRSSTHGARSLRGRHPSSLVQHQRKNYSRNMNVYCCIANQKAELQRCAKQKYTMQRKVSKTLHKTSDKMIIANYLFNIKKTLLLQ